MEDTEALHEEIRRLRAKVELLETRAELVQQVGEEGVWDWDMTTDEAYFSRRMLASLGYTLDEIEQTGSAFFSLIHPDDGGRMQVLLAAHLERREPFIAEIRMRAKDGSWLEIQSRGQAVWDADGKPVRMAGVQMDLTEHHMREREQVRNAELISIQRETIRALGVPILQVWSGVLCLPVIGEVDEERGVNMTTELLDHVTKTSARFVVLDLTGAEFKTTTAQYLGNMIRTLQLIGAQGVLCGISPDTAQIFVELQIDLGEVETYRDLGDALRACLAQLQR